MNVSIKLSSGRTIHHRPMKNGAVDAFIKNPAGDNLPEPGMTDAEYTEYCSIRKTVLISMPVKP